MTLIYTGYGHLASYLCKVFVVSSQLNNIINFHKKSVLFHNSDTSCSRIKWGHLYSMHIICPQHLQVKILPGVAPLYGWDLKIYKPMVMA